LIEYLNNGYEHSSTFSLGGFLWAEGASSLIVEKTIFRQNALLGTSMMSSPLFAFHNVVDIGIISCLFRNNLSTAGLISITGVTNTLNVTNSHFESNMGKSTAIISFSLTNQPSITLRSINLVSNVVLTQAILALTISQAQYNPYISGSMVTITGLIARENSGPFLLKVSNFDRVHLLNIAAVGNGDIDKAVEGVVGRFMSDVRVYMSRVPYLKQQRCSGTVQVESVQICTISQVTFNHSSCSFGSPALTIIDSNDEKRTKELRIQDIVLAHNQGEELIAMELSTNLTLERLHFENNTNLRTSLAVCLSFSAAIPVSVAVVDSSFLSNHGLESTLAKSEGIWSFTLVNVVCIGNTAKGTSAGFLLYPYIQGDSFVEVRNCLFRGNSARSNGVISIIDLIGEVISPDARIRLLIEECVFDSNFARFAGSSITLSGLIEVHPDSRIVNSRFLNNSCVNAGAALAATGLETAFEMSEFVKKEKLAFRYCVFFGNSGASVIEMTNFDFELETEECLFENSTVEFTTVRISHGFWNDTKSLFRYNKGSDAGTVLIISGTNFTGYGTMFLQNWSKTHGGAMVVWQKSQAHCSFCVFERNECETHGGAVTLHEFALFVGQGVVFRGNRARVEGAAVYSSISEFTCNNCLLEYNFAQSYTVVIIRGSNSAYKNGVIRYNQAATTPGVFLSQSQLSVVNCSLSDQIGSMGAFFMISDFSTLQVEASHFTRGQARNVGGSIYSVVSSTVKVTNSKFVNCSALEMGNVIDVATGMLVITNVTLRDIGSNRASAAISFTNGYLDLMIDCKGLIGNAIRALFAAVVIRNSSFRDIEAYYGSALYCFGCTFVRVQASEFSNCLAKKGGAFYVFTSSALSANYSASLQNCRFTNNRAVNGGAVYTESVNLIMSGCVLINNSVSPEYYDSVEMLKRGIGGAIFAANTYTAVVLSSITNNTFINNSASNMGGVLYWFDTYPTFTNNVLEGNSAPYGSVIASFPIRLALLHPNNSIVQYRNNESVPLALTLTDIASGQVCRYQLRLALIDQYEQIVTADSSSYAQIQPSENTESGLSGRIQVNADRGIFVFHNITLIGKPAATFDFFIVSDGVDEYLKIYTRDPHTYYPKIRLQVSFRNCEPGESAQGLTCYLCQSNTFSLTPSQPCNSCPPSATCYGGFNMVPKSGYWRPDPSLNIIYKCTNQQACLGSPQISNLSRTGICAEGYEGNLCAVCSPGYSQSGISTCLKCPPLQTNVGLTCLVGVIGLSLVALAIFLALRGARKTSSRMAIYVKIFVNFLQMLAVVVSIDLSWPTFVRSFLDAQHLLGNVAEQLFSTACILQETNISSIYFGKVVIIIVLPAVLIALFMLSFLLLTAFRAMHLVRDKVVTCAVVILFILHPSITKVLFSSFSCKEILPGEYWLSADMSIRCWNESHVKLLLSAVLPGLIVWVFGLPMLCFTALFKARNRLTSSSLGLQLSFLYKGYTAKHFYWEFVILYRKIALICSVVFFSLVSTMAQALSVLVVLLIYVFAQIVMRPFSHNSYHRLELKSLLTSLVTMYAGLYFESNPVSIPHTGLEVSGFLFALIIAVNTYFLVSWSREVWPLIRDTVKQKLGRVTNSQPNHGNDSAVAMLEHPEIVLSPEDVIVVEEQVQRLSTV